MKSISVAGAVDTNPAVQRTHKLMDADLFTPQQDGRSSAFHAAPCSALVCDETAPGKPYLVPMTLRKSNDFVAAHHRHNGRTARNGGKWSAGVAVDGKLVGVAIVGNPLSATLMDGWTAEVLRVCTIEDAPKGTCSMLYQACWRAWRAMGGRRLITYTLQSESGASLRGADWRVVGQTKPVKDGWRKNDHLNDNRTHSPVMLEVKNRWQQDDGSYSSPNDKIHP